jgi:arylsulfatase
MLGKQSPRLQRWFGLHHDTTAETYLDSFETWRANRDGPWAACLNLMDAHYPYEPATEFDRWGSEVLKQLQNEWSESNYDPAEFHDDRRPWWQLEAFESLYDGSIRYLDSAVERLVTHLESTGCLDETLLVVTSDHGERFGERSYFDPSYRLVAHGADGGIHDDNVHVPLVVKFLGQQTGHRVRRPASLTEFPSVVESVRNDDADYDEFVPDGPVLVTLDPGYESSACAVYDTDGDDVRMQTSYNGDGVTVAIRDAQMKCVVADSAPDARDRTWAERDLSVSQGTTDIDQSTRSHLADLGYMN